MYTCPNVQSSRIFATRVEHAKMNLGYFTSKFVLVKKMLEMISKIYKIKIQIMVVRK